MTKNRTFKEIKKLNLFKGYTMKNRVKNGDLSYYRYENKATFLN